VEQHNFVHKVEDCVVTDIEVLKDEEKKILAEKVKSLEEEREINFKQYSTYLMIGWIICNTLWVSLLLFIPSYVYVYIFAAGAFFQQVFCFTFMYVCMYVRLYSIYYMRACLL
jgi:hypothetical protein